MKLVALAPLFAAAVLSLPCRAAPSAPFTGAEAASDLWYYYRGGRVDLDPTLDRVALKIDAAQRERVYRTLNDSSFEVTSVREFPHFKDNLLTIVPLDSPASSWQELANRLESLASIEGVTFAAPVFRTRTALLIPTNELVVRLSSGGAAIREQVLHELGLLTLESFPGDDSVVLGTSPTFSPVDIIELSQSLASDPRVVFSHPNFIQVLPHLNMPNDTYFSSQWPLENTGKPAGTPDADIDALDAWDIHYGNGTATVAVIDVGVDVTHPDLASRIVQGVDVTDDDTDPTPLSYDAHGTACAGVAAAVGNNGIGVAGVCWNAKIMPIRVGYSIAPGENQWVTSSWWLAEGIQAAWVNGADILSNSWMSDPPSDVIDFAIDAAATHGRGGLGCVVVFAAGNLFGPVMYPAILSNVIAVSATNEWDEFKSPTSQDGETWWGSNFGPEIDLSAPGVHVWTTDILGGNGYNDGNNPADGDAAGDYFSHYNGTSSATPHVAGLAALVLSLAPDLTSAEVQALLEESSDDLGVAGRDDQFGHGRINAHQAILAALGADVQVVTGSINQNAVWNAGTIYLVQGVLSINANLVVSPGTIVKFGSNAGLVVSGSGRLLAQGLPGNKIVFTSYRDDAYGGDTNSDGSSTVPAPGDWRWLSFFGAGSRLDNCLIRYGGNDPSGGGTLDSAVQVFHNDFVLSNSTIEHALTFGISCENTSPTLTANTVRNTTYPVHFQDGAYAAMTGNSLTNNSYNAVSVSGNLTRDLTWSPIQGGTYPYLVYLAYSLGTYTLTIQPGTVVKLISTAYLSGSGRLLAQGLPGNKIVFTSYRDDAYGGDTNSDGSSTVPAPGDWRWLSFFGAGSRLDNCLIRYGGNDPSGGGTLDSAVQVFHNDFVLSNSTIEHVLTFGISCENTSPTLTANTVRNTTYPVHFQDGAYAAMTGNSLTNNSYNAVSVSGNLTRDLTWSPIQGGTYPYLVYLAYSLGTYTLTIQPGTVVKLISTAYLSGSGRLLAQGLPGNKIVFTSYRDDAYGGDTNSDGSSTVPAPGDWRWLSFFGAGSRLDNCLIRYGGNDPSGGGTLDSAVQVFHNDFVLSNSTIEHAPMYGISCDVAPSVLTSNAIRYVSVGVYVNENPSVINVSNIVGNTVSVTGGYAIYFSGNATFSAPTIVGNSLEGLSAASTGVHLRNLGPMTYLQSNDIRKVMVGAGLFNASTLIQGNTIQQVAPAIGTGTGIDVGQTSNASIRGNIITGFQYAIRSVTPPSTPAPVIDIRNNQIVDNPGYGVYLASANVSTADGPNATLTSNDIYGSGSYNLYLGPYQNPNSRIIDAENNWWGTTNATAIASTIFDHIDNAASPSVDFAPFAAEPVANNASELGIAPSSLAFTIFPDEVDESTLWLTNQGVETVTYSVAESNGGEPTIRSDIPWLFVNPGSGQVFAGDSVPLTVTISSAAISDGFYQAYLVVSSDDPVNDLFVVPITMTVSQVFVTSPTPGDTVSVAESTPITWSANQPWNVASADILYSTDGGATFPHTIVFNWTGAPPYAWTVTGPPADSCKVKVRTHYFNGETYEGVTDGMFVILGDSTPAVELNGRISELSLAPPWPNPTKESTTFSLSLPSKASVDLAVYDTSGRLVRQVLSAECHAGRHQVVWDGRTLSGHRVSSGVYFVALRVGKDERAVRLVMLK